MDPKNNEAGEFEIEDQDDDGDYGDEDESDEENEEFMDEDGFGCYLCGESEDGDGISCQCGTWVCGSCLEECITHSPLYGRCFECPDCGIWFPI